MKRLKKCLILLLALALVLPVAISCSNDEPQPPQDSESESQSEIDSGGDDNSPGDNGGENGDNGDNGDGEKDDGGPVEGKHYEKLDMTVMTFNIRYQNSNDTGVRSWDQRRSAVANHIIAQNAEIVCLQEVKPAQYEYLANALGSIYGMIWYGRDNTEGTSGEGLAIAYKKANWELVEKDVFWLSTTPEVASKGWGASIKRICVTALLENKATGARMNVYNAHLDNNSSDARTNGMALILSRIEGSEYPTYLCGDFNCKNDSIAYLCAAAVMNDAWKTSPITENGLTYNGWGEKENDPTYHGLQIDHMFFTKGWVETHSYKILRDKWGDNGENFISDHYGLKAEITLLYDPETVEKDEPGEGGGSADVPDEPVELPDKEDFKDIVGSDGNDGDYTKYY